MLLRLISESATPLSINQIEQILFIIFPRTITCFFGKEIQLWILIDSNTEISKLSVWFLIKKNKIKFVLAIPNKAKDHTFWNFFSKSSYYNLTTALLFLSGVTEGARWVRSHRSWEKKWPFLRIIKNTIFVLPYFNFCPALEER